MSRLSYAIRVTLGEEGGYSDRKADRGGATNYGVTQRTYDEFCKLSGRPQRPVKQISMEEVLLIYGTYWINHGAGRAIKLLQQTLGVDVDGIAGRGTMQALHEEMTNGDIVELCTLYLEHRKNFFNEIIAKRPDQEVFRDGWYNRIEHLRGLIGE